MVTTKQGEPVFTLAAKDFTLTDDGVSSQLIYTLEEDSGDEPLALVVAIQTGGGRPSALVEIPHASRSMIEAIVGPVPHKIAIVSFDSVAQARAGLHLRPRPN